MAATHKFYVLSFLNFIGGGERCAASIFDEKLYLNFPELVAVGEPRRVLDDLIKTSLFLKNTDQKLELIQGFETENLYIAEVRIPQARNDLYAAIVFHFSDLGIQKIQAFYPCERPLSLAQELTATTPLHTPSDVALFQKFLEAGQKEAFSKLFVEEAMIRDAHGRFYGRGATESLDDFWIRFARTNVEIAGFYDSGRQCAAEVKWRNYRGLFIWLRSEDRKFLSCRYYGSEKTELGRVSPPFPMAWDDQVQSL